MSDTRQCHVCEMQYQADHDVAPQDGTTLAICRRCLPYWNNGYQDGARRRARRPARNKRSDAIATPDRSIQDE